jgi:hypothetical protein
MMLTLRHQYQEAGVEAEEEDVDEVDEAPNPQ